MEVTLTLSVDETNVVLNSLSNLPFSEVAGLIQKIIDQGNAQANPEPEAEVPVEPVKKAVAKKAPAKKKG